MKPKTKLKAWLESEGETILGFAKRAGIVPSTANRAANGRTVPRGDTLKKIHKATRGDVSANDFHGMGAA